MADRAQIFSADAAEMPVIQTWRIWESLALHIFNIPRETSTFILWKNLEKEGYLISIDIYRRNEADTYVHGKVRFKPPPTSNFWENGPYPITLRNGTKVPLRFQLDSPGSNLDLVALKLEVCVLTGQNSIFPMRSFETSPKMTIDVRRREVNLKFTTAILDRRNTTTIDLQESQSVFRATIQFLQLKKVWKTTNPETKCVSFLFILDTPARYYRRLKDISHTFIGQDSWREYDIWTRQTALVHNPWTLDRQRTNLRRTGHIVDIGRWNVFRITFPSEEIKKGAAVLMYQIFGDHNIQVEDGSHFTQSSTRPTSIWDWIDRSEGQQTKSNSEELAGLADPNFVDLDPLVRYQLEVCISHGRLSEFTTTRRFARALRDLGPEKGRNLLEQVATERTSYINPLDIFKIQGYRGARDTKIPTYCCYMRTARVTPSTVYYNTPTVDTSNRITRRYLEHSDRFLRVRFTDEKYLGRIGSSVSDSNDEVYTRVKRTLANGITIGDRHYEFLAFGNSQFREHGAYFFAPHPELRDVTAASIRAWMGQFSHIRNIAKYAARLGQSFSTTRAVEGSSSVVRKIEDISHHGCVFSDGVGKVSNFLVSIISQDLKLNDPNGQPPSAFQFRHGGSKGMLVASSDPTRFEIHIRPSQTKYETDNGRLEIIRASHFSIATLNRQLILVLSARGIRDNVFHQKLMELLRNFEQAMKDDQQAKLMLRKYVDPNQMTLALAQMVDDGFRKTKEPFVYSLLTLWRTWHLKLLKEKAKIAIDKGADLLGCIDETGILKGHSNQKMERINYLNGKHKIAALPQIFVQITRPENGWAPEVITGVCIVARNPSLHPGDIRVVNAVDVPELRHLRNVIVFPQTGDQDIPGMCSGGDLDGDDFFIFWDKDLIPWNWGVAPMRFRSKKAPDLDHEVTVDEITSFFVTYMKHDCLPKVATAHMAWADRLPRGVEETKCLRLAQLHSDAVDYNKTGGAAHMTRDLEPNMWPHFMEKNHKPKSMIYHSRKILGQLYDKVQTTDFFPNLSMPFDNRILECKLKEASEEFMEYAKNLKKVYDAAMRRIMAQYDIATEFEVWSTWVLSHNNLNRDYNMHEDLGRIATLLRNGFRKECYEKVGGRFEAVAPLVVAMYRVTHEAITEALTKKDTEPTTFDDDDEWGESPDNGDLSLSKLPLISFPWIFHDYLGKIAQGHYDLNMIVTSESTEKKESSISRVYSQAEIQPILAEMTRTGESKEKNKKKGVRCQTAHDGDELPSADDLQTEAPKVMMDDDSDSGVDVQDKESSDDRAAKEIVETEPPPSALDKLLELLNSED
ncbi:hypothetical protein N7532_001655 [Penicillium argentinense]|uniref:RNA-dependent RNA polymerase n=1 Tax=Penicillium argentinense TaxID=1131581 RepID=A0A9W9KLZ1_9EURO|nr:uncharacterized protein N7532_001655 [Penicillium argentinense]KAJ5111120.1 hypothetical protein N7532_001655 [Penicillium argentinense]